MTRPCPPAAGADAADGEIDVGLAAVAADLERYAASASPEVPDGLVQRILDAVAAEPTYSPVGRLLAAMAPSGWAEFPSAVAGLFRAVGGRPGPIRTAMRIEAAALLVVLACIVAGTGGLAVLAVRGISAGPGPAAASPPSLVQASPPIASQPAIVPAPSGTPDASPSVAVSPSVAPTRALASDRAPGGSEPPPVDRSGAPATAPPPAVPSSPAAPSRRPEPSSPESPAATGPDASGEPADGGGEPTASPRATPDSSPSS